MAGASVRLGRSRRRRQLTVGGEVSEMRWETPQFTEVRMDAEINSYQDDFSDEI
jgi:coenzyme PQQ precursor peptide PqqA